MKNQLSIVFVFCSFLSFSQMFMPGIKYSGFYHFDKTYFQDINGGEIGIDLNWKFNAHGLSFYAGLGRFTYIGSENVSTVDDVETGTVVLAYNYYLIDREKWYVSLDLGARFRNSNKSYFSGTNKGDYSIVKSLSPQLGLEAAYIFGPVVLATGLDGIYLFEFGNSNQDVNLFPFVAIRGILGN